MHGLFLVSDSGEMLLLLGLQPKRKGSWLLLGFSDVAGFHPSVWLPSLGTIET